MIYGELVHIASNYILLMTFLKRLITFNYKRFSSHAMKSYYKSISALKDCVE